MRLCPRSVLCLIAFAAGRASVGGEAARFGQEAARVGHEAARMGNDALRRVTNEVEHRPLVMLAVAVGVGLLMGLAAARRSSLIRPRRSRRSRRD